jgi:hypothetical protein
MQLYRWRRSEFGFRGGGINTFNDKLDMEVAMSQTKKVAPPKEKQSNNILATYVDCMGKFHEEEKYPMQVQSNGKRYTFATRCEAEACKNKMRVFCNGCNTVFCFSFIKG